MSIEILHCEQCGNTDIPLGSVSVEVELKKHTWCDKCHNTKAETKAFFFCCQDCFHKYMAKVMKGEAKLEWKRYDPVFGQTT